MDYTGEKQIFSTGQGFQNSRGEAISDKKQKTEVEQAEAPKEEANTGIKEAPVKKSRARRSFISRIMKK